MYLHRVVQGLWSISFAINRHWSVCFAFLFLFFSFLSKHFHGWAETENKSWPKRKKKCAVRMSIVSVVPEEFEFPTATRIRHNQREKENGIDDILITKIDREDYFAHLLVDSLGKQQASHNYCRSTSFEASNHFLSFQIMIILQYSHLYLVVLSVLLRLASPKGKALAKIL